MLHWRLARIGLGCLALSCGAEPTDHATQGGPENLQPGEAARVGDEPVQTASVARIARAQGVSLEVARDRAVRDTLFARAAIERSGAAEIEVHRRRALARTLLHELLRTARAAGPPTDAEFAEWTGRRWLELDRPGAVRTVHAVVVEKKPDRLDSARVLAERLAAATRGAPSQEEFEQRARAVPAGDHKVVVQVLDAVTRDGRAFRLKSFSDRPGPSQNLDPTFAGAGNDLTQVGEQSEVVQTPFGFHVIYLIERIPSARLSREEQLAAVYEDVISTRAFQAEQAIRRKGAKIGVSPAFDTLTRLLLDKPGPRG